MNGELETLQRLNEARRTLETTRPGAGGAGQPAEPKARMADYLLAAAKDGFDWLIDLLAIGEIPFVGQIPGMLFAAAVAYHRLTADELLRRSRRRLVLFVLALILDNLPLVNNLPITFLSLFL